MVPFLVQLTGQRRPVVRKLGIVNENTNLSFKPLPPLL